ncbi:MAG: hypothetical protein R3202_08305, partial [Candidatus Competibacterales bacterium]|nr:hypothetical protein [Candidatus Competibacterales bacterium]
MAIRLCTLLIILMGAAPLAGAQNIYAGSASGSYTNDFCPKVVEAVRTEYFEHQCVTSQGTGDNIQKVLAEPTSIGIGQNIIIFIAGYRIKYPDDNILTGFTTPAVTHKIIKT